MTTESAAAPPSPPQYSADGQWWWTGAEWISSASKEERDSLANSTPAAPVVSSQPGQQMVAAAAPLPAVAFDASVPPAPGTPVPDDCVWARHPYPGPVQRRPTGPPTKRLAAMGLLVGRPYAEIALAAGKPSSKQELVGGQHNISWRGKDFWSNVTTTTLTFDRYGVCAGVAAQNTKKSSNLIVGVGFDI